MSSKNLFQGVIDRYNGITIDTQKEPTESLQFLHRLKESLQKWEDEKKRCIWFKVNIKDAALVPMLADEGFNFHHSRENFVMMYKWLPKNSTVNLPPACHTNLGVGGLVINERNEVLVVSELYIDQPHWKLPGGYVERGEDIKDGAIREVREETGVNTVFESMVTFRHAHNTAFGNSDIYVVVLLKPTSQEIKKSDAEIKECQWMNVDEYLNHPYVHEFNRFIVRQALDLRNRNIKLDLNKHTVQILKRSVDITSLTLEDL